MNGKLYIGGEWVESSSGKSFEAISPATGEKLGTIALGTRDDVAKAAAAARAAQPAFAKMTVFDRAKLCRKIADVVTKRREELARVLCLEQGKPLHAEAYGEVDATALFYRMAAEDVVRLNGEVLPSEDGRKRIFSMRVPRGVYGVITPWNFPLAIPVEYVGVGIATGNTHVWVPALTTSLCAIKLMECMIEAEVPPGVVNLVTGLGQEVGDEVAGHANIDALGFTGSPGVGFSVSKRAAGKPQLLELGGNAPVVVFADADIERAAQIAGRGAFWNAGQICDSTERILVERSAYDQFVAALVKVTEEFKVGVATENGVTLGAMHNQGGLDRVQRHVQDAVAQGAKILAGGKPVAGLPTGLYYPATVIADVKPEMLLNKEETFGPIAPVMPFDTEEEALTIANGSPTGLLAGLFTRDLGRAFRFGEQMQAGIVNVNEGSAYWQPHTPFGGASGKASGVGRLGGKYTLLEMTQLKTLVVDVG